MNESWRSGMDDNEWVRAFRRDQRERPNVSFPSAWAVLVVTSVALAFVVTLLFIGTA